MKFACLALLVFGQILAIQGRDSPTVVVTSNSHRGPRLPVQGFVDGPTVVHGAQSPDEDCDDDDAVIIEAVSAEDDDDDFVVVGGDDDVIEAGPLCLDPPFDAGNEFVKTALQTVWSYVPSSGKCKSFVYNGFGGRSTNRFDSESECVNRCRDTVTEGCFSSKPTTQCNEPGMECTGTKQGEDTCYSCCCIPEGFSSGSCASSPNNVHAGARPQFVHIVTGASDIPRWYFDGTDCVRVENPNAIGRSPNNFPCKEMCDKKCKP